jgi:hypothetical protein
MSTPAPGADECAGTGRPVGTPALDGSAGEHGFAGTGGRWARPRWTGRPVGTPALDGSAGGHARAGRAGR